MTVVETPAFLREAAAAFPAKERAGLVLYLPLFLLNVFAKNEKANLTGAERHELRMLLPRLVTGYRKGVAG